MGLYQQKHCQLEPKGTEKMGLNEARLLGYCYFTDGTRELPSCKHAPPSSKGRNDSEGDSETLGCPSLHRPRLHRPRAQGCFRFSKGWATMQLQYAQLPLPRTLGVLGAGHCPSAPRGWRAASVTQRPFEYREAHCPHRVQPHQNLSHVSNCFERLICSHIH